jgi:hypothetical protein
MKTAGTNFAVGFDMRISGERDTFHRPNLAKNLGRNTPQIRTAWGLIRACARRL